MASAAVAVSPRTTLHTTVTITTLWPWLLGGSLVVISRAISRITILITHIGAL